MLYSLLVSFLAFTAQAEEVKNIPQVGNHFRLFTVEKNEHRENAMVAYTYLDNECNFVRHPADHNQPKFDYYWLMNQQTFKDVNRMIKEGIHDRLELDDTTKVASLGDQVPEHNSFFVKVKDLKEMNTDLSDPRMAIVAKKLENSCSVEALIQLGPSDNNRMMRLEMIYTEGKKTFSYPFRKVVSVTLNGVDVANGEKISKTYQAK